LRVAINSFLVGTSAVAAVGQRISAMIEITIRVNTPPMAAQGIKEALAMQVEQFGIVGNIEVREISNYYQQMEIIKGGANYHANNQTNRRRLGHQ
jgi:ABC-type transport system substrate-binding protein